MKDDTGAPPMLEESGEDPYDRTRFRTGDRVMAWMVQLFFASLGVGVVMYFAVVWGWIGPVMG